MPGVVAEQLHEVRVAAGGVGEHGERVAVEGPAGGVGGPGERLQGGVVVEVVDRVERHPFAVGDGVGDDPGGVGQPTEHDHCGEFGSAAEVLHDRSEHRELVGMHFLDLVDEDHQSAAVLRAVLADSEYGAGELLGDGDRVAPLAFGLSPVDTEVERLGFLAPSFAQLDKFAAQLLGQPRAVVELFDDRADRVTR